MGLMESKHPTGIQVLNEIALRHSISISSTSRTWRIRAIIAAHRDYNNELLTGKGYPEDWKSYIKKDVIEFLQSGKVPYVAEKMASLYMIQVTVGLKSSTLKTL